MLVELRQAPAVVFKEPPHAMGNYVRFRLGPDVAIAVGARIKQPGDALVGQPVELSAVRQDAATACRCRTSVCLSDAMHGDASLFARQDVVEAAWSIVDPLIGVESPQPIEYEPGSWGPKEADALVAEHRRMEHARQIPVPEFSDLGTSELWDRGTKRAGSASGTNQRPPCP